MSKEKERPIKEREYKIRYTSLRKQCEKASVMFDEVGVPKIVDYHDDSGYVGSGTSIDCRLEHYINNRSLTQTQQKLEVALAALRRLACLGNGDFYGNSEGNVMAQKTLKEIEE